MTAILKSLARWLIAIVVASLGIVVLFWPEPPWRTA
jgi:hypothetical protein